MALKDPLFAQRVLYLYTSSNIPIALEGVMVSDASITLKTVGNPDITEAFIGEISKVEGQVSQIQGIWYGTYSIEGTSGKGYAFSVLGAAK